MILNCCVYNGRFPMMHLTGSIRIPAVNSTQFDLVQFNSHENMRTKILNGKL